MTFTFDIPEDKKSFQKIQVEYSGLAQPLVNSLLRAGIRTLGGVLSHTDEELKKLAGLKEKDLLNLHSQLDQKAAEVVEQGKIDAQHHQNDANVFEAVELKEEGGYMVFGEEEDIVGTLANYFGVDKEIIISHTRQQDAVRVRDYIAFLLREYGEMSYPAIGHLLGGRDHTTIIHAYKKMKARVEAKPELRAAFSGMIGKVGEIKERKLRLEKELFANAETFVQAERLRREPVFMEIPARDLKALELYREGLTLKNISEVIGVSRERVRQIVIKVVRQQAVNDSITKGITMDSNVLIEEESKKRKTLRESKTKKKLPKTTDAKRWSKFYVACKSCGTVAIPHVRNGLCEKCIGQYRSTRREEIVSRHGSVCDSCGISRANAVRTYGRDFYITKDQRVFCRGCFLKTSGKHLGGYKHFEWSRLYPACVSCGTTSVPHVKKGLCANCSDFITNAERERTIQQHGSICDNCGLTRAAAKATYGRDFYITKTGKVVCRKCFQGHARWGLEQKRANERVEKNEK